MWRQGKKHAVGAIKESLFNFTFVFKYFIRCFNFGLTEPTLIVKVRHVNKFEMSQEAGNEWTGIRFVGIHFVV